MAKNQLSYALGLDTQGYQQGLQAAARSTQQFEGDLNDMSAKFVNVRKELREAKRELMTLEAAWRKMSRAERESSMGQNMYQHMQDLIVKGGELQDIMEDTQETFRNYGSDTRNIDALRQGFDALGNTISAVAGAYATLTGDTEAAKRALTMYTTVQSGVRAFAALSNALRSTSPLMLMIKRAQDALRASTIVTTSATKAQTVATEGATIAQKAFNAVANANPYVLLATAVIGVVTALALFSDNTDNAAAKQEEFNRKLADGTDKAIAYQNAMYDAAKAVIGYLEQVGAASWDVQNAKLDAAKQYVQALEKEVKNTKKGANESFEAFSERLKKVQEKLIEAKNNVAALEDEINLSRKATQWFIDNWDKLNTDKQIQKAISVFQQLRSEYQRGSKEYEEMTRRIDILQNKLHPNNKNQTNNKSNEQLKTVLDQLKEQKAQLEKARENLFDKAGNITDKVKFDNYTKQIKEIDEALKRANNTIKSIDYSHLDELNDHLKELEEIRPYLEGEELDKVIKEIEDTRKKIEKEEIRLHIKVDPIVATIEEVKKKLKEIFTIKIEAKDAFSNEQINQIRDIYKNLPVNSTIKLDTSVELDTNALNQSERELGEWSLKVYNTLVNQLQGVESLLSLDDLDDSTWNMLYDLADELNIKLEEVAETIANLDETSRQRQEKAETITKRADAWGYYGEMIRGVSNSFDALGESNAVVMAQFAMNTAAMIADAVKTIAALQAEAISGGAASAAKLPFPANLAAIATVISTLGAIFASIPKFEHGGVLNGGKTIGTGIINSPYKTGDKNVIRVNGDEMILNKRQQAGMIGKTTISSSEQRTLFSMINSGRLQNYSNSNNSNIKTVTTKLINYNSIQKFANGGVVGNYNTSHYNSSLISNIHGQEVLLNKVQNNSFNNSIDTSKIDAIDITLHGETKLRGSDLDIMWKNFNTKTNRSR